ncbi:MCE family protein [Allokutzneria albata]|uniref:Phospholipid/cholesterol/gamma-HCH transport system substrate-binding protein n=1 Tax=Allokutzneria albata TaxID=211114 RepID=A0A1G9YZX9_ALLAB|nr:MlaD family protein [Allokutzneria albata]SDN14580.1 phospholipid/cholesterol/gamma-HCH transport system substrate-binding protein [Allokutzneria albata]
MLTRRARLQLIGFVLIALVGVSYAGARYAGLDRLFGPRGYVVTMELADAGGIFTNAEVTYRGVAVGRVGPLRLTADGVEVQLDIDSSSAPIPTDVEAVVTNRSAVGEQYVDLRPKSDEGPFLAEGSVIRREQSKTPLPVQSLLSNLDSLASSVPTESLRTVVDQLGTAFDGRGQDLQRLIDTARSFTGDAVRHLPQTLQLLRDGRTVLDTQAAKGSAITDFSRDLRLIADQLKTSDPDLRNLITSAPGAAQQAGGLIRESGQSLSETIANLLTTANVALPRKDGIEQLLVTYPMVVGGTFTVVPNDGTAHFGLALNFFDPPACVKGYEKTKRRTGGETSAAPLNTQAYCAEGAGSPIAVRGAQNAPYGGKPVTPPPAPGTGTGGVPSTQVVQQPGSLLDLLKPVGLNGPSSLGQLFGLPG